jgi:hypothetical protein
MKLRITSTAVALAKPLASYDTKLANKDGDDKLQQAHLLSIYIPPESNENPFAIFHIEHGYLWDWDDLVQDMKCASIVRGCNVPLKENELVNSLDIYNSLA